MDAISFLVYETAKLCRRKAESHASKLQGFNRWIKAEESQLWKWCTEESPGNFCRTFLPLLNGEVQNWALFWYCQIIGATTTGAAKSRAQLNEIGCPVVIAEEAAAVLEAHLVVSIPLHCKHAILIGDHQQLRPNPGSFLNLPLLWKLCSFY